MGKISQICLTLEEDALIIWNGTKEGYHKKINREETYLWKITNTY